MRTVAFPGLGLEFHLDRVAFRLGDFAVYWYGIIIAVGFLLAVVYCYHKAPKLGIRQDLFRKEDGSLSLYKMMDIRDGGLAIYGAVIVAFFTLLIFCRVRRINFLAFADVGVFGLFIGQCIGRWGNFMNVEAFGGPTELPWRMGIDVYMDGVWQYMEVHPTFFYESMWNLAGFLLLVLISRKFRRFDGQLMLTYFAWYGFGRGIIEGLRTDSLYFFHTGIRVSQVFGFATAVVAVALLVYHLAVKKHTPEELYVNRLRAAEADREASAPQAAEDKQEDA